MELGHPDWETVGYWSWAGSEVKGHSCTQKCLGSGVHALSTTLAVDASTHPNENKQKNGSGTSWGRRFEHPQYGFIISNKLQNWKTSTLVNIDFRSRRNYCDDTDKLDHFRVVLQDLDTLSVSIQVRASVIPKSVLGLLYLFRVWN